MRGLAKLAPGRENVAVVDRPEPELRPGYVVLAVQGAGICGTDLHIIDDEFRSVPPVTMGHEVCGVVEALGDGVEPAWLGARVVTETYFHTCGECAYCRAGRTNLCPERRSIGSAVDGGFAPRLLVPVANLHRVPEWLPSEAAALTEPLACVCHCLLDPAVVAEGDEVLVVGPGPVGLLAAQVALVLGGRVHVRGTERDLERLALAAGLGFATSVAGHDEAPEADISIECSGSASGMATCLERTRRGGHYVQIGLAGKAVAVPLDEVSYRELTVTSGNASTPSSWRNALALLEARRIRLEPLVSEVVPLEDWARAVAAIRAGRGVKYVLDPR
jgi:L-iditol 2-dehydrogenase